MAEQKAKEMEPVETQTVEIMPPDIQHLPKWNVEGALRIMGFF